MQHWNSYWSTTKSLNSFAEGEHSQGYVGEIADFWQKVFSSLPKSAAILDLAAGNGGLAVLAQKFNAGFDVYASDAANINPLSLYTSSDPSYQQLKNIQFFGNMPSENLTFDNEQFDRVISQFGFEYAEPKAALLAINRVLKPNGEFIALVHHKDSFISADCRLGLQVINNLSQVDGLLEQLLDFGHFCQTIIDKNQPTLEQQNQFKQKNANLLQLFKLLQSQCATEEELDWYNLLVKELIPAIVDWRQTDSSRVQKLIDNLDSFKQRLLDQEASSWSQTDIENISAEVESKWSACEFDAITLDTGVLCWFIKACK
ncbi:MAG: class I SAM-dependent methyltransferase [Cognaticolwellia sp.]